MIMLLFERTILRKNWIANQVTTTTKTNNTQVQWRTTEPTSLIKTTQELPELSTQLVHRKRGRLAPALVKWSDSDTLSLEINSRNKNLSIQLNSRVYCSFKVLYLKLTQTNSSLLSKQEAKN